MNGLITDEKTIVFLDEISWMAAKDKDFAGQLKIAWDTKFSKKKALTLVLCGSVSSWIDKNILNSAGFMGRISLEITLDELSLPDCDKFWGSKAGRISSREKLKLLSVTGGVPRYLEEINANLSAEENIKKLCFTREGFLFSEFNKIFNDIFARRAAAFKKIVDVISSGPKTLSQIAEKMGKKRNGVLSRYLEELIVSGFVSKDPTFKPGQDKASRLARYRLKDNYLRFYLKYIEPVKDKISKGIFGDCSLETFANWEVVAGLQFENLALNNLPTIFRKLSIDINSVKSASPYLQRKTARLEACQIDLLIQTKHTLYICEIKFRKLIRKSAITEVQEKARKLKPGKGLSVRPVLIYSGDLQAGLKEEGYFDYLINFDDLLIE